MISDSLRAHQRNINMNNLLMLFCSLILNGVFGADDVKVSVMEGESVTLTINPDDIKRASNLEWTFKDTIIAKIDKENKNSLVEYPDERFRDRLKVDRQTGSLTITNITSEDSGEYKLQIRGSREMKKTFRVSVSDQMQTESVVEGEFVILHTNTEKQADDVIKWKFKDTLIAQFNRNANNFSYDDPNGKFRERLTLDRGGSLTIRKLNTEDSGHYGVYITSSKNIIHKRFNVTVTEAETDRQKTALWVAVIVLVLIIFGLVLVLIYNRKRLNKNTANEASERLNGLSKNEKIETCVHLNQQSSNSNGT